MENNNNNSKDDNYIYDNGFHPKEVHLNNNFIFYRTDIWFKIINKITIMLLKIGYIFPKLFVWGFKVVGKENRKYIKGSVVISNHVHQLDATMTMHNNFKNRFYITTLESNMGFGWISKVFRAAGIVPIPTKIDLLKKFYEETPNVIKRGDTILVCPEGSLIPYCDHIRDFKPGAFRIALLAGTRIVPIVYTFHKPRGLYKLTRGKKPCIHQNILPPYEIKDMGNKKLTTTKASDELHKIMSDYFIKNSDFYYDKQD